MHLNLFFDEDFPVFIVKRQYHSVLLEILSVAIFYNSRKRYIPNNTYASTINPVCGA